MCDKRFIYVWWHCDWEAQKNNALLLAFKFCSAFFFLPSVCFDTADSFFGSIYKCTFFLYKYGCWFGFSCHRSTLIAGGGGAGQGASNPWLVNESEETQGLSFGEIKDQQQRIIEGHLMIAFPQPFWRGRCLDQDGPPADAVLALYDMLGSINMLEMLHLTFPLPRMVLTWL